MKPKTLLRAASLAGALAAVLACAFPLAAQAQGVEVVGGEEAPPGTWPFMASLQYKFNADHYKAHDCGAVLISPRDVLTAAHCVDADAGHVADNTEILLGTRDLAAGGRRVAVSRITLHPKYNTRTHTNDVAVIRLAQSVTDIQPITYIKTAKQEADTAPAGQMLRVAGWGETETKAHFPKKLRQVDVPVIATDACKALPGYGGVNASMFCAGYATGGKDSCQLDSGGPIVRPAAEGKPAKLVGVVSWGVGCAEPGQPGVYARLAKLGKWVAQEVAKP